MFFLMINLYNVKLVVIITRQFWNRHLSDLNLVEFPSICQHLTPQLLFFSLFPNLTSGKRREWSLSRLSLARSSPIIVKSLTIMNYNNLLRINFKICFKIQVTQSLRMIWVNQKSRQRVINAYAELNASILALWKISIICYLTLQLQR